MRACCASGLPRNKSRRPSSNLPVTQLHKTAQSICFSTCPPPVHPIINCTDMTELDLAFQTVCHRTLQAEKSLARQQALIAMLASKGQVPNEVEASLSATHARLGTLRAQRAEMARLLRRHAHK